MEWQIQGADAILAKLKALPDRLGKNAMRRALRKGARPIRDAARANAKRLDDPATKEEIDRNIVIASGGRRREKEVDGVVMRVGVMGGARFRRGASDLPGGNTTYWRFVEMGTSDTAAQPFLRPAGVAQAENAFMATAAAMQAETDKELAKL